jgi:uncharacterized protein (TIGR02246 family)
MGGEAALELRIVRKQVLAIGALLVACQASAQREPEQARHPSVELPPPLARVLTDYEQAWGKRDARALAALFAEDGFVLPNGGPPVNGRESIERHYQGHGGPLALRAIAFASEGTVAYVIGGYAPQPGDPDDGKFTLTLRKGAEGRWWIVSDMDSSNRPAKRP